MSKSQVSIENQTMTASQTSRETQYTIALDSIIFDEEIYPRVQAVNQVAFIYSENMKAGQIFPPILLGKYKGKLYLIDGKHRMWAHQILKRNTISAVIKNYKSKIDMLKDSITLNNHGKPLTLADKAKLLNKLREYNVPDEEIHLTLGISDFSVLTNRFITKEGKTVPIAAMTKKALDSQVVSEKDLAATYDVKSERKLITRTAPQAVEQMLIALQRNLIDFEDEDTKTKCLEILSILQARIGAGAAA
jgi:hypothetical protein